MRGRNKAKVKEKKIPPSICSHYGKPMCIFVFFFFFFCAIAAEVLISVKLFENLF